MRAAGIRRRQLARTSTHSVARATLDSTEARTAQTDCLRANSSSLARLVRSFARVPGSKQAALWSEPDVSCAPLAKAPLRSRPMGRSIAERRRQRGACWPILSAGRFAGAAFRVFVRFSQSPGLYGRRDGPSYPQLAARAQLDRGDECPRGHEGRAQVRRRPRTWISQYSGLSATRRRRSDQRGRRRPNWSSVRCCKRLIACNRVGLQACGGQSVARVDAEICAWV